MKSYLCIVFFAGFLLIASHTQRTLRKDLLIASFAELFKNANLGKSYW